ncbi:MAG: SUMF1/EgtB/PvdO family nonheme iron enzyme [Verrucomicrobia bacterium]|nr:SUMF1/EgtB/PvdO family nonheme iron enzyme [Verrucomicrobiota bacterium]
MRSWFVGMPGEVVSCAGCHEPQNEVSLNKPSLAARRGPEPIEPWHGPARGFSFVREVQPVLDKYCVSCHDGSKTNPPSFRGGEWLTDWQTQLAGHWGGGGKFTKSYFELQRFVRRPGIEGDRRMFTPLEFHFSTTELGQILRQGHHGVAQDAEAWERLAAWADLNAPFYGTWGEIPQFCQEPNGAAKLAKVNARAEELRRQYVPMGPHPNYDAVPETPRFDTTPEKPSEPISKLGSSRREEALFRGQRSEIRDQLKETEPPHVGGYGFERGSSEISNLKFEISAPGWPFDTAAAVAKQKTAAIGGQTTRTLALGDGVTLELVRLPGGRFVMGSTNGASNETPPAVVEVKPFWMARFETANRQFKQFHPEHESRTEDRHGYQFGRLGYDQDQPNQPAVRVSWEEAMAFCRWLSQKSGLTITLPTEAQWEWACRAGTATPFWFGDHDADFSPFANLGDKMLAEFAADTALDNYSDARPMVNPSRYDDWIPRDDRFDDGGFVTEPVGKYRPNPWGLHDTLGNAWEWTRSACRPYPYRDDDGRNDTANADRERVVRGGSWYDRPQRCTSSFRLAYPSWQRVFNVGFRVVCEEPSATAMGASR